MNAHLGSETDLRPWYTRLVDAFVQATSGGFGSWTDGVIRYGGMLVGSAIVLILLSGAATMTWNYVVCSHAFPTAPHVTQLQAAWGIFGLEIMNVVKEILISWKVVGGRVLASKRDQVFELALGLGAMYATLVWVIPMWSS